MALHRLGRLTGKASGVLCMAIVSGAIVPFGQAALADSVGLSYSFLVPAACYFYVMFFGWKFSCLYPVSSRWPSRRATLSYVC